MKKIFPILLMTLTINICKISGQSTEAVQLLLNVEKLAQLKSILSNMYKGYKIVSSGYNTIKDLSKGNFNLHQAFLDRLLQTSPTVRNYKRISEIVASQSSIVREYRSAFNRFQQSNLFNSNEIQYMDKIYGDLISKSLKNMNELLMVVTAGKLRMSDDERINAIDRIFLDMQDKVAFLRVFNQENNVLAIQRGRELVDTRLSKKLQGL